MKFISTKAHGILDYLTGILLTVVPLIYLRDAPSAAVYTLAAAGVIILIMSFFTNYEFGAIRKISIINHQMADKSIGVALAISPWIFGFDDVVYGPHMIMGFICMAVPTFTKKITTTLQLETNPAGEVTRYYLNGE